jgi:hypothetical protein
MRIRPCDLFRLLLKSLILSTFGMTPSTEVKPVTRPLPTQNDTTQKNEDKYLCLEWDCNPQFQCQSSQDPCLSHTPTVISPVKLYLTNFSCSEPAFKNRPKLFPKRNNSQMITLMTTMLIMVIIIIIMVIIMIVVMIIILIIIIIMI